MGSRLALASDVWRCHRVKVMMNVVFKKKSNGPCDPISNLGHQESSLDNYSGAVSFAAPLALSD
jgi:hypothetical protein